MLPGRMKRCWRDRKEGEVEKYYFFCGEWEVSFAFVCLVVACVVLFCRGCCRGEERIRRAQKVSRIELHDVKLHRINKEVKFKKCLKGLTLFPM